MGALIFRKPPTSRYTALYFVTLPYTQRQGIVLQPGLENSPSPDHEDAALGKPQTVDWGQRRARSGQGLHLTTCQTLQKKIIL